MDRRYGLGISHYVQCYVRIIERSQKLLVCDGLDTLAEVSFNGTLLGKTDNMYRQWSWEVTDMLKESANEISILFRAPVTFITERQKVKPLWGGGDIPSGPHLRKASCQVAGHSGK
jgi:beta-mannosidase